MTDIELDKDIGESIDRALCLPCTAIDLYGEIQALRRTMQEATSDTNSLMPMYVKLLIRKRREFKAKTGFEFDEL